MSGSHTSFHRHIPDEKSGYSTNQKIENLTKQKFQNEIEGKRIPFKISDIERLASMKAY
jgi:hypothetical protein